MKDEQLISAAHKRMGNCNCVVYFKSDEPREVHFLQACWKHSEITTSDSNEKPTGHKSMNSLVQLPVSFLDIKLFFQYNCRL